MNNNQRDPRWANVLLGTSSSTIGAIGCFISAIGNAIGTTPDVVNNRLKAIEGYDDTDLVDWAKLAQAFPGITAIVKSTYDNQDVLTQLAAGNRVLVVVSAAPIGGTGIHCVEYIGNGQLKDPWTGTIRPTSDFPDLTGEYIIISGQWQQSQATTPLAIATEGLQTYGLDPTNEQSNQIVFTTWNDVKNGLYVPVAQFNALKIATETLQENFDKLQDKQSETQKELTETNSTLAALKKSDYDYGQEAIDANKLAKTYQGYMDDVANILNLPQSNQSDAELHTEIIHEISQLQANQKASQGSQDPTEVQTVWQTGLKSIVTYLLGHGFKEFLNEKNAHVFDAEGNLIDDTVSTHVIEYLDSRFSRLDLVQEAIIKSKLYITTGKTLIQKFFGLFYQAKV